MTVPPPITVYTAKVCPYCVAAKNLLTQRAYAYTEVDVSTPELREMLLKKAQGRKTVPQIFIGALHVGGYDDLEALDRSGELEKIVHEATLALSL